jgi:hypothetical protein
MQSGSASDNSCRIGSCKDCHAGFSACMLPAEAGKSVPRMRAWAGLQVDCWSSTK